MSVWIMIMPDDQYRPLSKIQLTLCVEYAVKLFYMSYVFVTLLLPVHMFFSLYPFYLYKFSVIYLIGWSSNFVYF
jgi:hypothetical protein